ncbi:hypothetical protein E2C01_097361 [Portunus trituberculatus]|uniref:Uncharacterized protein n=1 Tax=Portunus trituberculatus TaxID=210409 RepID=A0A5B7K4M1_PORTR|nr:hypothetical protein [Portunus trituberculatus]
MPAAAAQTSTQQAGKVTSILGAVDLPETCCLKARTVTLYTPCSYPPIPSRPRPSHSPQPKDNPGDGKACSNTSPHAQSHSQTTLCFRPGHSLFSSFPYLHYLPYLCKVTVRVLLPIYSF